MKRAICIFFLAAAACGGQISGGGPDAGNGPDSSPGPSPICPANAPAEGTSCSHSGAECEYGTNSDYLCNTLAECTNGQWLYSKGYGDCSTGLGPDCPSSSSQVPQGAVCNVSGERCNYPDIVCECSVPNGPATPTNIWECEQPEPGCPVPRPRIGSACTAPADLQCDYGTCTISGGVALSCIDGAWTRASVFCAL